MVLSDQQMAFWRENGCLASDQPLLTADEVQALADRAKDIASGTLNTLPAENFSVERTINPDEFRGEARYEAVLVPRKSGHAAIHHSLTLHHTAPNRRRGLAFHSMRAETRNIGYSDDRQPPFLLVRGQEFPGRV
jgi:hypothetical protein